MLNDIKKVLVSEEEIESICQRLGSQISKDYEGKDLLVVGILKGAVPFFIDLVKHITIPMEMDFIKVSSYNGTTTSHELVFKQDLEYSVKGKNIIFVDDIVDTGRTLSAIGEHYNKRGASSIEFAVLLDKPEARIAPVYPKYIGTNVPKEFVVGYGLDYQEKYRNLPFVGVLKDEIYK